MDKKRDAVPPYRPVNRYEFIKSKQVKRPPLEVITRKCRPSSDSERERRNVSKWRKMIGACGADWKEYARRNPNVVKSRIRKGIPDCLRGLVWQLISGSRDLLLKHEGVYDQLLFNERHTSTSERNIITDISRIFPTHVFYRQVHGPGQTSLYNVLMAYSVYDREVGYVQGMGSVAALLLLYMCEEDAFWLLVALLKGTVNAPMRGLYLNGLPLVHQYLFQFKKLVEEQLPQLGIHFEQEMIHPAMYATEWFITCFCSTLPFPLVLRIWDVFLYEGVKIVFKVGLALLKSCEDELVKLSFQELLPALSNYSQDAVKIDKLLPIAHSMKVTKRLEDLKLEYSRMNEPQSQSPKASNEEQQQLSTQKQISSRR